MGCTNLFSLIHPVLCKKPAGPLLRFKSAAKEQAANSWLICPGAGVPRFSQEHLCHLHWWARLQSSIPEVRCAHEEARSVCLLQVPGMACPCAGGTAHTWDPQPSQCLGSWHRLGPQPSQCQAPGIGEVHPICFLSLCTQGRQGVGRGTVGWKAWALGFPAIRPSAHSQWYAH